MKSMMTTLTRRYWAGEIDAFQADEILKTEFNFRDESQRLRCIAALQHGLKVGYRAHLDEYRRTFSSLAAQDVIPMPEGERVTREDLGLTSPDYFKHIWEN